MILFGGIGGGIAGPEQWEWNGAGWTRRSIGPAPAAIHSSMTFDAARSMVVLYGGAVSQGASFRSETWEWDGASWRQRTPPSDPGGRNGHVMAFDSLRRRVVLFGGYRSDNAGPRDDTWEYDGTTWMLRASAHSPAGRFGACAAYDARRGVVVVFGGRDVLGAANKHVRGDTWEWDGTDWHQGPDGPPARRSCALVYDGAGKAMVLFGGATADGFAPGDTWIYR